MFNCLCINDLFALQRYKNFWTFLLFSLCFKALSTIYMQVGNFSFLSQLAYNSEILSKFVCRFIAILFVVCFYLMQMLN